MEELQKRKMPAGLPWNTPPPRGPLNPSGLGGFTQCQSKEAQWSLLGSQPVGVPLRGGRLSRTPFNHAREHPSEGVCGSGAQGQSSARSELFRKTPKKGCVRSPAATTAPMRGGR